MRQDDWVEFGRGDMRAVLAIALVARAGDRYYRVQLDFKTDDGQPDSRIYGRDDAVRVWRWPCSPRGS